MFVRKRQEAEMRDMFRSFGIIGLAAGLAFINIGACAQTLQTVKKRGELICGVSEGLVGFSIADNNGKWTGFDVDFCRAVSAAVLGEAEKVRFVPISADERFQALKDGKVDLLSRNSTWTLSRESEYGLTFAGVTYYDGQGFMVPKASKVTSALELDGAKVCVVSGTTTKANLSYFFAANSMKLEVVEVPSPLDAIHAYEDGRCGVISSDSSQLHAEREQLARPNDHIILADVISKEPLGPAVRRDDPEWSQIVKWVNFAMLDAEELGVSSKTLDDALRSSRPDVRWLVGKEGALGAGLGLSSDWALNIIRGVGNYAEVYERNVGFGSKLGIPRGLNQLWSNGGIQYAPPLH
jgi:general L-amino acid transport system substrate-binding protein